jgi:hypothetical protein
MFFSWDYLARTPWVSDGRVGKKHCPEHIAKDAIVAGE